MMNNFVKAMQDDSNVTMTENGAFALRTSGDSLVDLFFSIGAMRNSSPSRIEKKFSDAFAEDGLLATKMAFYARNVRGGLGERDTARCIWRYLAQTNPEIMRKNMVYIPTFGRWDDMFCLVGTPVEQDMWALLTTQFHTDMEAMKANQSVSLLSKWLPSTNSKKSATAKLGHAMARKLKVSDKEYRQMRSMLNAYLDVVEVKMSKGDFSAILYSGVTSKAMTKYRNAFHKHDGARFEAYLDSLVKGETKINASTLYPYDILEAYNMRPTFRSMQCGAYDAVLEEQWKALPNYVEGENNVLVMADTSGSMSGRPMATSVGLATYFAERNKGVFKDVFMTFSSRPEFVTLKGSTLRDKVKSVPSIVDNTNLIAAFDKILDVAVKNHISEDEMPKSLVVISDMQFDYCVEDNNATNYDNIRKRYARAGYEMPNIIFWNVRDTRDTFEVKSDKSRVQMYSGQSPATFKSVLNSIGKTPLEAVIATLNDPAYSMITL